MRKRVTDTLPFVSNDDKDEGLNDKIGKKRKGGGYLAFCAQMVVIMVISFFMAIVIHKLVIEKINTNPRFLPIQEVTSAESVSSATSFTGSAQKCTQAQLDKIRKQLDPGHMNCYEYQYNQQCPITQATKCFKDTWLTNYYSRKDISIESFIAVTIGSNFGFRSVDLLRMGTMDSSVNVASWGSALKTSGSNGLDPLCDEGNGNLQISIPPDSTVLRKGVVYCVEELPTIVDAIGMANINNVANYASKGLVVHNYLISSIPGKIYHPKPGSSGPCDTDAQRDENCVSVPVTRLDSYMEEHVSNSGNINVLEVTNGHEFDALIGGLNTLKRTEYLIFKLDWKGRWEMYGRTISAATSLLNKAGFTCYWAGIGKLWRISSCEMNEYLTHKFWSNVACANRNLAPRLVEEMETLFLKTIK